MTEVIDLDVDLEKYARELAEIYRHPEYRAIIEEMERTPEDQRLEVAQRLVTREELERRGVPLPEGFRVTLRWFEDGDTTSWPLREVTSEPSVPVPQCRWSVCGSIGWIVCGSIGGDVG